MLPIAIAGDVWTIEMADPGSPLLVDRTGKPRLAVTDPSTRTIRMAKGLTPPLLDKVLLHEVAHAITISHGLLAPLRSQLPPELWVLVEEWSASLVEGYAIEASVLASNALGRPLCVRGFCMEAF